MVKGGTVKPPQYKIGNMKRKCEEEEEKEEEEDEKEARGRQKPRKELGVKGERGGGEQGGGI